MSISRAFRALQITGVMLLAASPAAAEVTPPEKPPLVLVLSGGGARGAAHIGVLKVLEEMHIVPDMVVGTSMGSIVGGLYAAGWSPEEIHQLLLEIDWDQVFSDKVDRPERSFRRKQDDRPYLIASRLHFDEDGFYLPPGVLGGQSLQLMLSSLEARTLPPPDFDEFPIPFRAVASDLTTGDAVVIDSGSLAAAMRASMAIPGMFAPVLRDGRTLGDGGSVANLPVGVAKSMGPARVIAVDISSPLMGPDKKLKNFWDVFSQMNSLLTVGNRQRDVERLEGGDIYLRPELGDLGFLDFDRASEAVAIGEAAARAQLAELERFAVDDASWIEFVARHRRRPSATIHIDRVAIENSSRFEDDLVRAALHVQPPVELDPNVLDRELLRLYNLRHAGVMSYRLEPRGEEKLLVVQTPEPDFGPHTLQLGVGFFDDFSGETGYTLTARHQYMPANRRGGEWENVLQLGTASRLSSEFYQPLAASLRWFAVPSLSFERGTQEIWLDGKPWAEYRVERSAASVAGGRVLGNWGELRLRAFYELERGAPRIGIPGFPNEDQNRAGFELGLRIDTEDASAFPTAGSEVELSYARSETALGSDVEFERVFAAMGSSWSIGQVVIDAHLEYGDNFEPSESFFDLFFLGGPGRLSGLGSKELWGDTMALAKLGMRWKFKDVDFSSVRARFFLGMSLEAGNTFFDEDPLTLGAMLLGGSVYVAAETPIGPVYLGYGVTEGRRNRVYFAIGDHF